jgi:hypothetical protein
MGHPQAPRTQGGGGKQIPLPLCGIGMTMLGGDAERQGSQRRERRREERRVAESGEEGESRSLALLGMTMLGRARGRLG